MRTRQSHQQRLSVPVHGVEGGKYNLYKGWLGSRRHHRLRWYIEWHFNVTRKRFNGVQGGRTEPALSALCLRPMKILKSACRKQHHREKGVVILTDSLSLATVLKCGHVKKPCVETIRGIKHNDLTTDIPAQSTGIWYNETVEQLTGVTESMRPIQMHSSDIRKRMRVARRENRHSRTEVIRH